MSKLADIGVVGLGVMGASLAINISGKGYKVVVYNRTSKVGDEFIANNENKNLIKASAPKDLVEQIKTPRKILIMVKAGDAVDSVIEQLCPLLDKGDVLIDGGNSNYKDTLRRYNQIKKLSIGYIGCGVSGGEQGALKGPCLMPGGNREDWKKIKEIWMDIAGKDYDGNPTVTYVGENASGHFVKMVHNGIEYAIMQIMSEVYHLLQLVYGLNAGEVADVFEKFQNGKLNSYLFEISLDVLRMKDELGDGYLIDQIRDVAGQKGTGKWTSINGLDLGVALPTITEAVFARFLSTEIELRKNLKKALRDQESGVPSPELKLEKLYTKFENAIYIAMLTSYAQGFHMIVRAAETYDWNIDLSEISRIWEGGCIIRSKLINDIRRVYKNAKTNDLHLFEMEQFQQEINNHLEDLRTIVKLGVENQVPLNALSVSLGYIDSFRYETLPANMIQGLRDRFGAHGYERTDREGSFHTDWEN